MSVLTIASLDPIKTPLIARLYKAHYPSGKAKKNELTIVGYKLNRIVCVVRFRPIEQFQLLTGMLVVPEHRGEGYAHQLMSYCRQHTLSEATYCFAYSHLEPFYQKHGFATIEQQALPNSLKCLYQRYVKSGKDLIPMHYLPDLS